MPTNGHNGHSAPRGGYFLETDLAWGPTATSPPWPDARRGTALPPLREPATGKPRLDVTQIFRNKNLMLIGSTGFVGKVALSMLLHRYPDVGRVYCLVRPGAGNTADERFYKKVASSEVFDPVRAVHGAGFEAFLRSKIVAVPGDIGRPLCNFSDEQFADFDRAGGLHVILNSAGLVSFAPSLESALRINAMGAKNVLDAARKAGARLCHVSTCYVAGRRDGDLEIVLVVGIAPLFAQRGGAVLAELRDVLAIVGALARLVDHLLAIGDLGRRIEVAIDQLGHPGRALSGRQPARRGAAGLGAREVADHRLV
ncbi:MAG TPA: SDR family oxidoreductase, partial [Kofleriaceae bacterium]|nr:SDR family oxidoreductase [Kofleriaceae bacterium]